MANNSPKLMVFGGSGNIRSLGPFVEPLSESLNEGRQLLKLGRPAVEIACRCVEILENAPRLNAGLGSALNQEEQLEMDAAIMDGHTQTAGAIAGIDCVANPIILADELRRSNMDPVMLTGLGALRFAIETGFDIIDPDQLITVRQLERYQNLLGQTVIDGDAEEKLGTVGCVVIDSRQHLAVATSTGGLLGKYPGRVSDSAIIGAGTFADCTAATSCTGQGEKFILANTAHTISTLVGQGFSLGESQRLALDHIARLGGRGGVISISRDSSFGSATVNVAGMPHGVHGLEFDEPLISLDPDQINAANN